MKFIIEYGSPVEERLLTYIQEECSFDMEPIVSQIDFELILNKISLSVVNDRIIQLWGFCGFAEWLKSNYQVPEYKKGSLRIEHNLKYGFAYGIDEEDWPIYANKSTGWICIGDPEKSEKAVEFINNCVAVVDDTGQLVSLWLKPLKFPKF